MRLALVDVSYSFWSSFYATQGSPADASRRVMQQLHGLTAQYDRVIACLDKGQSFRKGIYPAYKATREDKPPAAVSQLRDLTAQLRRDYRVAESEGLEGDDIIATLARWAAMEGAVETCHIIAADKDLYQCVGGKVALVRETKEGQELRDGRWVFETMGCLPEHVPGWLALVGDASDNLPGVKGIGQKTATELFRAHGTLTGIVRAAFDNVITGAKAVAIIDADTGGTLTQVERLATLRTDAPIDIEKLMQDKTPEPEPVTAEFEVDPEPEPEKPKKTPETKAIAVVHDHTSWVKKIEPQSFQEAWATARALHDSGLFAKQHTNAQSVLAVIMAGRELGLSAMSSLRGFHVISTSKSTIVAPSAHLLVGICLRSKHCEYFDCIEMEDDRATWVAKRKGRPEVKRTWTLDMAKHRGLYGPETKKDKWAWESSAWFKYTPNMLSARASSELARMVFPDVTMNTYAAEEMDGSETAIASIQSAALEEA